MSTQVGRISGPLLKDNLLRDGIDLAFETQLLYLDVNNNKIGINTSSPIRELYVPVEIQTTNLIVDNHATITTIGYIDQSSEIGTLLDDLIITATNVTATHFGVGGFDIDSNKITLTESNADFELRPDGSGILKIVNDFTVYGSIHATGNITLDGNVTFGSGQEDNVTFASDVNSNIIPDLDITYSLGSNYKRWNNLWSGFLNGEVVDVATLEVGPIDPSRRQGNIWYVAVNGTYSNVGDHPNGPFGSIEKALSVATSGDTVYVYPGTYYELFPLTVPAGVTIIGTDLRNTIIVPDTASEFEDVFLLNDGCTIQNLTIKNFYFDSINNKGYAFRFAPTMEVLTKSPYIQNCSVITKGTVTSSSDPLGFLSGDAGKGAYIDSTDAALSTLTVTIYDYSSGNSMLTTFPSSAVAEYQKYIGWWFYNGITKYIISKVDTFNSQVRFMFGNSYYTTNTGQTITLYGPQKYPSMLFHSATFITPGVDTITMTNGVRVEWLDSFTYYANKGLYASDRLNFNDYINLVIVDSTSTGEEPYYGDSVLYNGKPMYYQYNPGPIGYRYLQWSGSYWYLTIGGETWQSNSDTFYPWEATGWYEISSTGNPAPTVNLHENIQIGAEVRSINSANVYGNYGAEADGSDTLMYLINHNFAYIGTGYDTSNDPTLVIQANETIELNSGKIHYVSFDHAGTFRVGDTFWVDLKKGTTSFDISSITANDLVGIKLIDGDQITYIDYSKIETGNIQIAGNTIQSTVGPLNIASASNEINLDQDVFITKNLAVSNNVTIAGQLNLGNAITDIVTFDAEIDDNLDPKVNVTYNIGSPTRNWKNIWTRTAEIADIEINTNYIKTTVSNSDLELRTSGTGTVLVEDIRVQQRTVTTDSGNIQINPATTLDITASTTNINGIVHVTNDLSIDSDFIIGTDFSNTISFKASINSSIEPQIDQVYSLGDSQRSWNLYTASMLLDDIEINDNYIRTTASNLNLELKAAGSGSVQFEKTYVDDNRIYTIGTNLKIEPATTLDITGNTTQNGILYVTNDLILDSDFTIGNSNSDIIRFVASINSDIVPQYTSTWELGDTARAWNLYTASILLDDIEINDNYIRTTASNLNLELKASGTGSVLFEETYFNENVISTVGTNLRIEPATTLDITASTTNVNGMLHVTSNTSVDSDITFGNSNLDTVTYDSYVNTDIIPQSDSTWNLGDTARAWNLYTSSILLDDIEINDNYIRTTASNLNLELKASGTGAVLFEKTYFNENVISTIGTNLKIEPATTLDITASTTTTNGNLAVSQNITIDSNITFGNSSSDTKKFNARVNTDISPNVDSTYNLGDTARAWNLYTDKVLLDDIEINDNYIRTTASNLNLELKASGIGAVRFERVDFNENIIRTNGTTNLEIRPATTLDIYATTSTVNGNLNVTGNFNFDGTITIGNQTTDTISFVSDIDSDLLPDADNTYNIGSLARRWNILWAENTLIGNIEVNTNYITTTSGNLDLILQGNSSGGVLTEDLRFRSNTLESKVTNQNIQISLTGTSILDMNTNTALRIARGSTADRPTVNMLAGDIRFNTTDSLFGGFTTARTTFGGIYSADRLTYANATPTSNIINFITQGITAAYVDTSKFWLNGLNVDSFTVQNNVWSTNNIDLIFDPDLNNTIDIDNIRFDDNNITNLSNSNISLASTGAGYVKFEGAQGIKIPAGDDSQRPGPTPPQGTTRWSTENDYLEIFIGTSWQISTSSGSGFASISEINELSDLYTLMLG